MILFRLSKVLVSFWGYINKIMLEKLKSFIIVYINNIFNYIKHQVSAYINTTW